MSAALSVVFLDTPRLPAPLRKKTGLLKKAVMMALAPSKAKGEVTVVFMTDAAMRKLNKERLGHDYVTDVIAFNYDSPRPFMGGGQGESPFPFGDIAICIPQARRQAKDLGHDLLTELVTLAAHGALHLVGFRDHSPPLKKKMFARQDQIVRSLLK